MKNKLTCPRCHKECAVGAYTLDKPAIEKHGMCVSCCTGCETMGGMGYGWIYELVDLRNGEV